MLLCVLVTAKSVLKDIAVLTTLVLVAISGSVTPAGVSTRAEFVMLEGPLLGKFPVIWIMTRPNDGKVGMVAATPVEVMDMDAGHAAPLVADVQVAAILVKPGGKVSTKVAPFAAAGPLLSMVNTYENASPPLADTGPVLVICKSAVCACAKAGTSKSENIKKQKFNIRFGIIL